jgi:hypothetical protein
MEMHNQRHCFFFCLQSAAHKTYDCPEYIKFNIASKKYGIQSVKIR